MIVYSLSKDVDKTIKNLRMIENNRILSETEHDVMIGLEKVEKFVTHHAAIFDGKVTTFSTKPYSSYKLLFDGLINGKKGKQYYSYPEGMDDEIREYFIIRNNLILKKYLEEEDCMKVGCENVRMFRHDIIIKTLSNYPVIDGSPAFLARAIKGGMLHGGSGWMENALGITC